MIGLAAKLAAPRALQYAQPEADALALVEELFALGFVGRSVHALVIITNAAQQAMCGSRRR